MSRRDPRSPAGWQRAVDLAAMWLAVDAARQYGLISTSAEIDAERCREVLARGQRQGITPRPPGVTLGRWLRVNGAA